MGDMTPELLDSYIVWRKEIKQHSDATINHAWTPILKACAYASEMSMIDPVSYTHLDVYKRQLPSRFDPGSGY